MGKLLDDAFEFYAAYHDNKINQLIHIICVWPILWTAFVFLTYAGPISAVGMVAGHPVTWLDLVALMYGVYYMIIEQPGLAGPIASCMIAGCWFTVQYAKEVVGADVLWKPCVGIHITCWIAQFYGHGAHEGRAPALLDNLFQAIFMAPLFVLMEVMFKFGYRPEFQVHIQKKVDIAIAKFRAETGRKDK